MPDIQFSTITDDEWDTIPTSKPKPKESPWDAAIQALIDGQTIALPYEDEKDLRGTRIGIARRASKEFNVKLDFRADESRKLLAVRLGRERKEKVESVESSADAETPKRGPGRPKKQ